MTEAESKWYDDVRAAAEKQAAGKNIDADLALLEKAAEGLNVRTEPLFHMKQAAELPALWEKRAARSTE